LPSAEPSSHPSVIPSAQPSNQPSTEPSKQPSAIPSVQPSSIPSVGPSRQPSAIPSSHPSSAPSEHPSVSIWPTSMPSEKPSISSQPSISMRPSSQPSENPSVSIWPTAQPSSMPSSAPSLMPSSQPSAIPSAQPSAVPSSTPSDGVVYWLTTSMTTYTDEGVCGPRGDDAVADLSPCRNGQTIKFSFEGTPAEPFLDVNGCNYSLILYHECIPDHMSQTTTLTMQKQVTLPNPMPAEGSAQYIALADGFRDEIENAILAILDPETQTVTVTILNIGTNGGRRLVDRRLQEGTVESQTTVTTEITCEESCAGVNTTESASALEESAAAATGSTVTGSTSESVIASMEPSSAPSSAPSSQPSDQPSTIPSVPTALERAFLPTIIQSK